MFYIKAKCEVEACTYNMRVEYVNENALSLSNNSVFLKNILNYLFCIIKASEAVLKSGTSATSKVSKLFIGSNEKYSNILIELSLVNPYSYSDIIMLYVA